ncbi:MAG: chorismate-binding protein, partial [Muribaculaceae bacterium]|nr:chorismate-binding protein [Muribaculaceae bacterium]
MNWFAYRLPHKSSICTGASEQTIQGIMPGGFAVSPFSQNDFPTFTIPHASDIIDWKPVSSALFPKLSTTPSEHSDELEEILRQIENGIISKCIAATVLIEHGDFDLKSCFNRLCEAYPSAFVFAFSTSITGTWIGASPELLLKYNGGNICTMSLAGTKPLKDTGNWDAKNIHEQKLVTDFITETLTTKGITPKVGELKTMSAGPVKHLCNIIEGNSKSWQHATELALQLSPTPALCGFPRDEAKKLIKETEHFCRSYYG